MGFLLKVRRDSCFVNFVESLRFHDMTCNFAVKELVVLFILLFKRFVIVYTCDVLSIALVGRLGFSFDWISLYQCEVMVLY